MDGESDLTAALRALLRQRRESMQPPTDEELIAYWEGSLSPEEQADVEARIAAFPESAEILRDLNRFEELEEPPGATPLTDEDVATRWQAFREELEEEGEWPAEQTSPSPVAPLDGRGRAPSRGRWWHRGLPPWLTMAAAAVALVVGVVGGALFEGPGRPQWVAPEAGGRTLALSPGATTVRGDEELPEVEAAQPVFLLLALPADATALVYRVELEGPGGRQWEAEVQPSAYGELNVSLPSSWVIPGSYRLTVRAPDGTEVGRYRFEAG